MFDLSKPVRVLLDNGVLSHSQYAVGAKKLVDLDLGNGVILHEYIEGFTRKPLHDDQEEQKEMDLLFTIGKLIRDGAIVPYTYTELKCEKWRGDYDLDVFNALQGCDVIECQPPIERRKFSNLSCSLGSATANQYVSKNEQKIFLIWLAESELSEIDIAINQDRQWELSDFEIDSFKNISWFQGLCKDLRSPKNYPDAYHLWTAERNKLDVFLTLEKKLPKMIAQAKQKKRSPLNMNAHVMRPSDFLQALDIVKYEEVPMEVGKFYDYSSGINSLV